MPLFIDSLGGTILCQWSWARDQHNQMEHLDKCTLDDMLLSGCAIEGCTLAPQTLTVTASATTLAMTTGIHVSIISKYLYKIAKIETETYLLHCPHPCPTQTLT